MLDDFRLPSRQLVTCAETGIDSLSRCLDKQHFQSYPHQVQYQYNSRGFRDQEWPENLTDAIWCLGDSFTVGVGSPVSHTWAHILQQKTGTRCINVSLDGASNSWISRRAVKILTEVQPSHLVIHWSYMHRVETPVLANADEDRRQLFDYASITLMQQLKNFNSALESVECAKGKTNVIYSHIPDGIPMATSNKVAAFWSRVHGAGWPDVPTSLTGFNLLPKFIKKELKNFDPSGLLDEYYASLGTTDHQSFIQYLGSPQCIPELTWLDLARDGHHYDIKTADFFTDQIVPLL